MRNSNNFSIFHSPKGTIIMKMLEVARFHYVHESYGLCGLLDSEEIPYHVENEYTLSVHPFLSNAVGGVIVKVPQAFEEQVKEVLKARSQSQLHLLRDDSQEADDRRGEGVLPYIARKLGF
jgi:hypothetical protein